MRWPNIGTAERFWRKVEKGGVDDCWFWKASRHPKGYGRFRVTIAGVNTMWRSHQVAWWLTNGHWGGLHVCHTCDNPPCCNPSHLFLGTNADNVRDRVEKNRTVYGAKTKVNTISAEQAVAIRWLAQSNLTQVELGKLFGISAQQVGRIAHVQSWRHVG